MNSSTEIPKEAKVQDDARASLAAVRTPWYRWQAPALQLPAVVFFVGSFFMPNTLIPEKWSRAVLLIVGLALWVLNDCRRERIWRRLIELEAPELYRRIKGTDA